MEKWVNKKQILMKWRLYELHSKAIAPHLRANVFYLYKKKSWYCFISLKGKEERELSESKRFDEV